MSIRGHLEVGSRALRKLLRRMSKSILGSRILWALRVLINGPEVCTMNGVTTLAETSCITEERIPAVSSRRTYHGICVDDCATPSSTTSFEDIEETVELLTTATVVTHDQVTSLGCNYDIEVFMQTENTVDSLQPYFFPKEMEDCIMTLENDVGSQSLALVITDQMLSRIQMIHDLRMRLNDIDCQLVGLQTCGVTSLPSIKSSDLGSKEKHAQPSVIVASSLQLEVAELQAQICELETARSTLTNTIELYRDYIESVLTKGMTDYGLLKAPNVEIAKTRTNVVDEHNMRNEHYLYDEESYQGSFALEGLVDLEDAYESARKVIEDKECEVRQIERDLESYEAFCACERAKFSEEVANGTCETTASQFERSLVDLFDDLNSNLREARADICKAQQDLLELDEEPDQGPAQSSSHDTFGDGSCTFDGVDEEVAPSWARIEKWMNDTTSISETTECDDWDCRSVGISDSISMIADDPYEKRWLDKWREMREAITY